MAGRGGPKLKEYRQHITSVRHWLKEIEFDGLIVTEVYCGAFGNCQVILPTLNQIMMSIDDSEEKIKWLVINVAKLEEEQRQLLAEEEKKKAELESVQRRKVAADGGAPSFEKEEEPLHLDEEDTKIKSAWDKITIPKLEKYSKYDSPRPLWLFMKDGQVLYELSSANPPKMNKLVLSVLNNTPLSEKELWEMDFHPDPNAKKKRKKKNIVDDKKKKKKDKRIRVEALKPAEFLLQVRLLDVTKPADALHPLRQPVIVLYTKDGASDDFIYYGQTERVHRLNSTNGDGKEYVFFHNFRFPKQDLEQNDIECKFVVYEAETEDVKKEHPPVLGDAYIKLNYMIQSIEEGQEHVIKLAKKHATHKHDAPSSPRSAVHEEHNEEDNKAGLLSLCLKTFKPEGVITPYRFSISCKHLPGFPKSIPDSARDSNASPRDPASPTSQLSPTSPREEEVRHDYIVVAQVGDSNTIKFGTAGKTERQNVLNPVFETPVTIEHFSRDDRVMRFCVYDGEAYDPMIDASGYLGSASVKFETYLQLRKHYKNVVELSLVDVNGRPITAGPNDTDLAKLFLKSEEINEDGTIEPFEEEEGEIDSDRKLNTDKLEISAQIREVDRVIVPGRYPLIALFHRNSSGDYNHVGTSERVVTSDTSLNLDFHRPFYINVPKEDVKDTTTPRSPSSVRSGGQPAHQGNFYKLCVYDSEIDDYLHPNSVLLAEVQFEVNQHFIHAGPKHDLILNDSNGRVSEKSHLFLTVEEVGRVENLELQVSGFQFAKLPHSTAILPNPFVRALASVLTQDHALLPQWESEHLQSNPDPQFTSIFRVMNYRKYNRDIKIQVYDEIDPVVPVQDSELIGEVTFKLHDYLSVSKNQIQLVEGVEVKQGVEFKLLKDGQEVINSFISLLDVTPKPPPKKDDEEDDEPEIPKQHDYSLPELSKEEKEFGTSPAMTDGSKITLTVSVHDIPKKDWLDGRFPCFALYKKNGVNGQYEFVDATERARDESDKRFEKVFILDNPQGSQFYKFILVDAPKDLTANEFSFFSQFTNFKNDPDKIESLRSLGGGSDHLGEVVVDVQKLLIRSEQVHLQDYIGGDVPKTVVNVGAMEIGVPSTIVAHLSATSLPRSELFNKTDPVGVLSVRNINTGDWNELGRTERVLNNPQPTWLTPVNFQLFSRFDRELKLAVYDSDADGNLAEKDLLGEATFVGSNIESEVNEFRLFKNNYVVTSDSKTATITLKLNAGSLPSTRPTSARPAADQSSGAPAEGGEDASAPASHRPDSAAIHAAVESIVHHDTAEQHEPHPPANVETLPPPQGHVSATNFDQA